MNIWLVNISEPCFIDGKNVRLQRTALVSRILSKKNHRITYFTSSFFHETKKQRVDKNSCISNQGINYFFIKTPCYKSNISIKRLINHICFAIKLQRILKKIEKPDLIYSSYPCIFHSYVATRYAKKNNIPILIDIRDLWPDIFSERLPRKLKILKKILLLPFDVFANYALKNATALTSMFPFGLKWGQEKSKRMHVSLDKVFYLSYHSLKIETSDYDLALNFWNNYDITSKHQFNICFFGTLGSLDSVTDLFTPIEAVKRLSLIYPDLKLIICGCGETLEYYQSLAKECSNIIFPGFVDSIKISVLMSLSKVGLIPYKNRFDFVNTIPNKAAEYLSGGVPIVTSLSGYINEFLKPYNCIKSYTEKDVVCFSNLILSLYQNQDQLKIMSKGAKQAFEDHFNADKEYPKMIDYFVKLMVSQKSKQRSLW